MISRTIKTDLLCGLSLLFFFTSLIYDPGFIDKYNPPKALYFISITFLALLFIGANTIIKRTSRKVELNLADLIFIVFNLFYIIPFLFQGDFWGSFDRNFFLRLSLLGFYFIIKNLYNELPAEKRDKFILVFILGIIIIAFIQDLVAIKQILSHDIPKGAFDNSGPYANFLAIIVILASGSLLSNVFTKKWIVRFILFFIFLSLFILIYAKARTAWVALPVGVLLLLFQNYHSVIRKLYFRHKKNSIVVLAFLLAVVSITGWYMYQMKKDSADGRILIWKTTFAAISEKPLFGHGPEGFQVARGQAQVNYFVKHWDYEHEKILADDLKFAFNDYLQITAETGIAGFLLFFLLLILAFNVPTKDKMIVLIKTGLAVLFITSLFSYSLQRISTMMLWIFFLAILSANMPLKPVISINLKPFTSITAGILITAGAIAVLFFTIQLFIANHRWKNTYQDFQSGESETAVVFYNKLYPILKGDPYFLYNYGVVLSMSDQYNQSIAIFEKCKLKLYDNDLLTFLGNSYKQEGDYLASEQAFLEAIYLVPHKFLSRYQLAGLYIETGQTEDALYWANEIIGEEPKVPSPLIEKMKNDMLKFVTSNSKK